VFWKLKAGSSRMKGEAYRRSGERAHVMITIQMCNSEQIRMINAFNI
jgi:hypothetical protein